MGGGLEELKDAKDPDAIHAYSEFAIPLTPSHIIICESLINSASVIIVKRQYFFMVVRSTRASISKHSALIARSKRPTTFVADFGHVNAKRP